MPRASAGGTLSAVGQIRIAGTLDETVNSISVAFGAGFVGLGAAVYVVNDSSTVQSYLDNGVVVEGAGSIAIMATGNQSFDLQTYGFQVGANATGASFTELEDGNSKVSDVYAGIGTDAVIGEVGQVGNITVQAQSNISATVDTKAISGGAAAIVANFAFIDITPSVVASIGDSSKINSTGNVDVFAGTDHAVTSSIESLSIGGLTFGVSDVRANDDPTISATVGGAITADNITVSAAHQADPATDLPVSGAYGSTATAESPGGGGVSINASFAQAYSTAAVTAGVNAGAALVVRNGGTVNVTAQGTNYATATGKSLSISLLVGIGLLDASTNASGDDTASIGDNARISGGNLSVVADGLDYATSSDQTTNMSGLASLGYSKSSANATPSVSATIGDGADINMTGNVALTATGESQADAYVHSLSASLVVDAGMVVGTSTDSPMISAVVNSSSAAPTTIVAGADGTLSIQASQGNPVSVSNGTIKSIDTSLNQLTFASATGLSDGDRVTYYANGHTPIGGLTDQQSYGVIVINPTTIELGEAFAPSAVNSQLSTITLSSLDGLQSGDPVVYGEASNATGPIGGLVPGNTYYVRVLSPTTIKLCTSVTEATQPDLAFQPSALNQVTGTFTINNNGFTNGQAVTYRAPPALQIAGFASNGDLVLSPPAYGTQTLSNDELVTFTATANGGGTPVPLTGLNQGESYYVYVVATNSQGQQEIQLSTSLIIFTSGQVSSANFVSVSNNAAAGGSTQSLRPSGLAGAGFSALTDGGTYYVKVIDANDFQLAATPGGATILPNQAGISSTQYIGDEGIPLQLGSITGEQWLALPLSGSLSGNQQLNGAGGLVGTSSSTLAHNAKLPNFTGVSHATGVGPGFALGVTVVGADATVTEDSSTTVSIGSDAALASGSDLSIGATDDVTGDSQTQADAGGLLAGLGTANSTVNLDPTAEATVGAGASIDSGGNLTLGATSAMVGFAESTAGTGGLGVAISGGKATVNGTPTTTITVGGDLAAVGNLSVTAQMSANGSTSTGANSIAILGSGGATSASWLIGPAQTTIEFQTGSLVQSGQTLTVTAEVDNSNLDSNASASSASVLVTAPDATATTNFNSTVAVNVDGGATLIGYTGLTLEAENSGITTTAEATANGNTGIYSAANATADTTDNFYSNIAAAVNSTLEGMTVNVTALVTNNMEPTPQASTPGFPGVIGFLSEPFGGGPTQSANATPNWNREIQLNGDVTLPYPPTAELLVNSAGNVVTSQGITAQAEEENGKNVIYVNPINFGAGGGTLNVSLGTDGIGAGSLTGAMTLTVLHNWGTIDITNQSSEDLWINAIQPFDATGSDTADAAAVKVEPSPFILPVTPGFGFVVQNAFGPTTIDILNTGTGAIVLNDLINNPIGTTNITNTGGDIRANAGGRVRSNRITLAGAGNIGEAGVGLLAPAFVPLDLVELTGQAPSLTAQAGGGLWLDLTPLDRDPTASSSVLDLGTLESVGNLDVQIEPTIIETQLSTLTVDYYVLVTAPGVPGLQYLSSYPIDGSSSPFTPSVGALGTGSALENTSVDFSLLQTGGGNLTVTGNYGATEIDISGTFVVNGNGNVLVQTDGNVTHTMTLNGNGNVDIYTEGNVAGTATLNGGGSVGIFTQGNVNETLLLTGSGSVLIETQGNVTGTMTLGTATLTGDGGITVHTDGYVVGTMSLYGNGDIDVVTEGYVTLTTLLTGVGHIDVDTDGAITITESVGDLRVGTIISRASDVILTAPGNIVDAISGPAAKVTGNNLTFTANGGSIGSYLNDLEIVSAYSAAGLVTATAANNVYLEETSGSLSVNQVTAGSGDVRLTALYGAPADSGIAVGSGDYVEANDGSITLQSANSLTIQGSVLASVTWGMLTFAVDQEFNGVKPAGGGSVSLTGAALRGTRIRLLSGDNNDVLDAAGQSIPVIAYGYGGNDTITGGSGNDQIYGGSGTDLIQDGNGSDLIVAGTGVGDVIIVGNGNDTIYASPNGSAHTGASDWNPALRYGDPGFSAIVPHGTYIQLGSGKDVVYGQGGDDEIIGGGGNDVIHAGPGNNLIVGGGGAVTIYGGGGNDVIYAFEPSSWGGVDTDVARTIYGGTGNETIYGGGGNDLIYGGSGSDTITAGNGNATIWGGLGADTISAGNGNDIIHGGLGNDTITSGDGSSEIYGGAGNNSITVGNGNNVIYGSPTGNDSITTGNGADRVIGGDGNDTVTLGSGNDIVTLGTGIDTVNGGAGSDVVVGGGGTDTIYGHNTGTDAAVDYIYGDVGTAGQVFAGPNDVVEVGYASSDSFAVVPTPVPAVVLPSLPGAVPSTLPAGTAEAGRWGDLGGSASGDGLSNDPASLATSPSVAVNAAGDQFVAWTDTRNGSPQVFVAEVVGGVWTQLGGSASGNQAAAGVSAGDSPTFDPSITVDASGAPIVSWTSEHTVGTTVTYDIYAARYNSATQTWVALGSSLSGGGISGTGTATDSHIVATANGPMVVWLDDSSGAESVYAKIFNGTAWVAIGGSASGTGLGGGTTAEDVNDLTATTDGNNVAVAWTEWDATSGVRQIYLDQYTGSAFSALSGSASGPTLSSLLTTALPGYISNDATPSVAYFEGSLFVAWQVQSDHGAVIAVAQYASDGASAPSLVNHHPTDRRRRTLPTDPTLSAGGNALRLAWISNSLLDLPTVLYVMRFNGSQFAEELPGEASGGGVSFTGGATTAIALATDSSGRTTLVWEDTSSGDAQIYARGMTATVTQTFVATAGQSIQSILTSNTFTAGDTIVVEGAHTENLTLSAADAGVLIYGAPGASLTGSITVGAGANGVLVQRLAISGSITVNGASGFVLTEASAGAITLNGGSGAQITYSQITGNVTLNGAVTGALIDHDTIHGTIGVDIEASSGAVPSAFMVSNNSIVAATGVLLNASGATGNIVGNAITASGTGINYALLVSGLISGNTITASTGILLNATAATATLVDNTVSASSVGLDIAVAFAGLISDNSFTSSGTGLLYNAPAALIGNTFRGAVGAIGTVGVITTVTGTTNGLGFVAGSGMNHIVGNTTGVEVLTGTQTQPVQIQLLDINGNTVGVTGSGILGGNALATANLIENNTTGVAHFLGIIQYNRFSANGTAIDVTADMSSQIDGTRIWYNLFYNNTGYGILIDDASDVRIYQNTFYSLTGDNIHLQNGASNVEIQGNILWAQGGYDIYVENNSQSGFYSDYNDLYSTGKGILVYWTQNFTDILDWQDDVARYDLHSIGSTVVNPGWANPDFVDINGGDFSVFPTIADLRFTSPTQGASNVLLDQAVPTFEQGQNLLTNPSFESGTTGWTYNQGASVTNSPTPGAYEGTEYFSPGSVPAGFAEQTVDLLTSGFTTTEINSGLLQLAFGGRIRAGDTNPRDTGSVTLSFYNAGDTLIEAQVADATNADDRWELVGARVDVPVGTVSVVLRFDAVNVAGGNDVRLVRQRVLVRVSNGYAPNQGAYGSGTQQAASTTTPQILLRSPDFYLNWDDSTPHTIEWQTLNNNASSEVNIELLQDTANGPVVLKTIVEATPDNGSYIWTPAKSGIPANTAGLRIQVSLVDDSAVLDRSQETFTIPPTGTNYYVNDGSLAGNQYTTALGSNRNTGKTPDSPLPNPVNVLRQYTPVAGDVLYVDTGNYSMIDPIADTGSLTVNLSLVGGPGLNAAEGFTITGPTDAGDAAVLYPAIPGNETLPLVYIDAANNMTIEHLTLEDANRGLYVVNGSSSFDASYITAEDNLLDGINISSDSPFADFDHLVSYRQRRHRHHYHRSDRVAHEFERLRQHRDRLQHQRHAQRGKRQYRR